MIPRGDYLYVRVSGQLVTTKQMLEHQRAIEAAMTPELEQRVIIDGRDAERPSPEIRAGMWTWMSESPALRRVAIVANEDKTKKRIKRTAEMNRMRVVGFGSLEEAEAWVTKGG